MELYPDMPINEQRANILKRAEQLLRLRYTPLKAMPSLTIDKTVEPKQYYQTHFPPLRPVTGANYSAVRYDEKYLGQNVSFETFSTAVLNPNSVLYTRTLHGRNLLGAAWYGSVCSQFVSYCFGFPFQIDCQQWPFLPGVETVDPTDIDTLALCDVLNDRTRHTALITGIDRDKTGHVIRIHVSEQTPPHAVTTTFTVEEFKAYWVKDGYEILRLPLDTPVDYIPDPYTPLEGEALRTPQTDYALLPDYGDKANYQKGSEVVFTVFQDADEIVCNGPNSTHVLAVTDSKAFFVPESPGYYTAYAKAASGSLSAPAYFAITDTSVSLKKNVYTPVEPVQPTISCPVDDSCVGWVVKTEAFAKYWGFPIDRNGMIPREAYLPVGNYLIIAMHKNAYGVYSSAPCFFAVAEDCSDGNN